MDRSCLIITSHIDHAEHLVIDPTVYDEIIAADGGNAWAETLGITPTRYIGDYDSGTRPEDPDAVILPCEKDMTDSEAAIDWAVSLGITRITVLGGLGGRFDHTMGNIGMLAKYLSEQYVLEYMDGSNLVRMKGPGTHVVSKDSYHYLGLIAYGGPVTGLTVTGTKYPLQDFTLTDDTTLGVSNEILQDSAELSFTGGKLLVIQSNG